MRWLLATAALVAGGLVASAAPVPVNEQAERRQLETLWAELDGPEPVGRVRAAFALMDHPRAVPFLAGKLPPVEATSEQVKGWLRDLDSDDEKVWQPAFERLKYFNPRLALAPADQLALITTDNGRRLLFNLWGGALLTFNENDTYHAELTLDLKDPDRPIARIKFRDSRKSTIAMSTIVEPLKEAYSAAWDRANLAAHVLARMDTKESRAAIERLASGHKDAKPTRTATLLLKAKAEKLNPEDAWNRLIYLGTADGFDTLCHVIDTPASAKLLKEKLPAIKASKEQVTGWLKALDNEDPKVWRPAFEQLLYFRPRIALDWQEQVDTATTAHGRTALFHVWEVFTNFAPDKLEVDPACTLGIESQDHGPRLKLQHPDPKGEGYSDTVQLKAMDEMFSYHWQRVRLAIVALERMKSAEAKAVLTQLADGHPDILPTKEAKAALERLSK